MTVSSGVVPTDLELLRVVLAEPVGGARASQAAASAWRVLVERHSPRMYAVGRSLGLDPQSAEDLVQTAWLRLLERGDQLRDGSMMAAWLCTIVRNEGLKLITRRREAPTASLPDHPATGPDAADRLVGAERATALRLAFARLDEPCRELLRLTLADPPLGYDVIAAVLGRPRGSLGPTRRRCLDRLLTLLPAGFDDEGDVSGRVSPGLRPEPGPPPAGGRS